MIEVYDPKNPMPAEPHVMGDGKLMITPEALQALLKAQGAGDGAASPATAAASAASSSGTAVSLAPAPSASAVGGAK